MEAFGLASTTAVSIPVGTVAQGAFLFVLGLYAIFSAILYYHWQTYSTNAKIHTLTMALYFLTTIPLLIIAGLMVLMI